MVNQSLFEQFLQLDAEERREFVRAAQATVDDDFPAHVLAEVDRRLAEMGPGPATDYVTLDELRNQIAKRRDRRTA